MNFKDQIPQELYRQIVEHIQLNCKKWKDGAFRRGRLEEDALTGDFWGQLSLSDKFKAPNGWSWNIEYNKVRGRGPGATEKLIGSDGVFQIHIKDDYGRTIFRKSFLFQAKMKKSYSRNSVLPQIKKMNEIMPKIGVLVVYGENSFDTYMSDDFQDNTDPKKFDICEYIVSEFFKCQHGVEDMYFDMDEERLIIEEEDRSRSFEYLGEGKYQVVNLNILQKR